WPRHDESPDNFSQDHLAVQYTRLTAGHPAWLRVSIADIATSVDLVKCLGSCSPAKGWRVSGQVESYELNGLPAARLALTGTWQKKDYQTEIVAVQQTGRVYFFSATFPASDEEGREQVRQAIAAASWGTKFVEPPVLAGR